MVCVCVCVPGRVEEMALRPRPEASLFIYCLWKSPSVMKRLRARGGKAWRPDQQGTGDHVSSFLSVERVCAHTVLGCACARSPASGGPWYVPLRVCAFVCPCMRVHASVCPCVFKSVRARVVTVCAYRTLVCDVTPATLVAACGHRKTWMTPGYASCLLCDLRPAMHAF